MKKQFLLALTLLVFSLAVCTQANAQNTYGMGNVKTVDNGLGFMITQCVGNSASQTVTVYFTIINTAKPNQKITVKPNTTALDFNSTSFKARSVTLGGESGDNYDWGVSKELPYGLSIKGSITYMNVLPIVKSFSVANIYEQCSNWDGDGNRKDGTIEVRNLKINWDNVKTDNTAPPVADTYQQPQPQADDQGESTVKNLDNGLDFLITDCTGDISSQRVTVSFTISNPAKVNQKIMVRPSTSALDFDSNPFKSQSVTLADQSGDNYDWGVSKELPYGLTIKGSITFINVLPTVKKLALVNIYEESSNWDGGGDRKNGTIEVRNLKIDWKLIKTAKPVVHH